MLTTIKNHGLTLAIFAALSTGLISFVYYLTAPTIAQQATIRKLKLLDQVIPNTLYDNSLINECYTVTNKALGSDLPHHLYVARKQQEIVAFAVESTAPKGYSGAIQLVIGMDIQGTVLGVRVTEHRETPGLGDKIESKISNWIDTFKGKQVENDADKRWNVRKEGGEFDQFSGATVTPRAIIHAVKDSVQYLKQIDVTKLPPCEVNE